MRTRAELLRDGLLKISAVTLQLLGRGAADGDRARRRRVLRPLQGAELSLRRPPRGAFRPA